MRSVPSLLLLATALAACSPEPERTAATDPAEVKAIIDSLNTKLEGWYAAGHVDSVASVFTEDTWQMPPNNAPLVGRDSLASWWRGATGAGKFEFDFSAQDVVAEGRIAVERGKYTMKFTPNEGAPIPAFEDRGNYVVMWRKDADGHWRIAWDAPVSELPLTAAQADEVAGRQQ